MTTTNLSGTVRPPLSAILLPALAVLVGLGVAGFAQLYLGPRLQEIRRASEKSTEELATKMKETKTLIPPDEIASIIIQSNASGSEAIQRLESSVLGLIVIVGLAMAGFGLGFLLTVREVLKRAAIGVTQTRVKIKSRSIEPS